MSRPTGGVRTRRTPRGDEVACCCKSSPTYELAYKDGRINVSSLINDLEIPTIGILRSPGFPTLFGLRHDIGSVPGDGASKICSASSGPRTRC